MTESKRVLWGMVGGGVFLQLLGGTMAVLSWPGTDVVEGEIDPMTFEMADDKVVDTGSAFFAWAGVALCGVGSMILLVALVGYGVYHGLRAHSQESAS